MGSAPDRELRYNLSAFYRRELSESGKAPKSGDPRSGLQRSSRQRRAGYSGEPDIYRKSLSNPEMPTEVPDQTIDCGPRCIVKVGGSLLDLPDLPIRLWELIGRLEGPVAVLPGGGPAADVVRDWAGRFELTESVAHWLAVDSLSLTARLVCDLLNREGGSRPSTNAGASIASSWKDACRCSVRGQVSVLDARSLLRSIDDQFAVELPESWAVTSDSIAAALAIHFEVPQLVLCKSVGVPSDGLFRDAELRDAERAASAALPVDDWFRHVASRLNEVRWCNLRTAPSDCVRWRPA